MSLDALLHTGALTAGEALLRLCLAALFGLAIGFDRELRDKPAGLRTHAMISLAACSLTVVALSLVGEVPGGNGSAGRADPLRAIEAVATGVAFLGAGAIIQSRGGVHGLTTGAGMWLAGAIGLACGGGFYFLAVVVTALGLVLLVVMGLIEKRLIRDRKHAEGKGTVEPRPR
ncbi:MAG: MgtC/SapB family protein [Candidatus Eiseniibacteriota bacterium]